MRVTLLHVAVIVTGCGARSGLLDPTVDAAAADETASADVAVDSVVTADTLADSFVDSTPTLDAITACSPDDRAARWKMMASDPIAPPAHAATLDLGGADGAGITLAEAEAKLCPSTDLGDKFGDGTRVAAWGDGNEVWLAYDPATKRASSLTLWTGYIGQVVAKGADGHRYAVRVGVPMTKDGAPLSIPVGWPFASPAFIDALDELDGALLHTFAPSIPAPSPNCMAAKTCPAGHFGPSEAFVIFTDVRFVVDVADRNATDAQHVTPNRLELYRVHP